MNYRSKSMSNYLHAPKVSLGSLYEYGSGSNINSVFRWKNHKCLCHVISARTWDLTWMVFYPRFTFIKVFFFLKFLGKVRT